MKIICTQENLRTGLQQVSRIVSTSSTLPILNNVLLQTENGQLKISATNLEMGMNTLVRCKIEQEGAVCLSAKVLLDLVNNLPNENINIEVGDTEVAVSTERYQTKIKHLPIEDFPLIPAIEDGQVVVVGSKDLKSALDSVSFASSTSETQPEISGVLFNFDGGILTVTATDRYRLAEMGLPLQTQTTATSVIVPHRSVAELSRLLGSVDAPIDLHLSATQIAISLNDTYLVTRLIDGKYPEYAQIIPTQQGTVVTLEHTELLSALKTTGIFSRGAGSVSIAIDAEKQVIQVLSSTQGIGESVVEIPCTVSGPSDPVILNYRYVLDLLTNNEPVTLDIHIIDNTNPVVFRPHGKPTYLYLIMPINPI